MSYLPNIQLPIFLSAQRFQCKPGQQLVLAPEAIALFLIPTVVGRQPTYRV
jgi:hypothetical protein